MDSAEHFLFVKRSLEQSAATLSALAQSKDVIDRLCEASRIISAAYRLDGCLFVAGNGGSAADAQHLVAELVSKLSRNRTPIRAFAMTVDTSILTAIGNDYGFEKSFSRQVEGLMREQDVLLTLSTSGNSSNVLAALQTARAKGIQTIIMTGHDGGRAREMADLAIIAPGATTAAIQECHLVLYHTLCGLIERDLIHSGHARYVD